MKRIGIALAAYQPDPNHLLEQLKSIQNQSHTNWFCVLTFDSSLENLRGEARFSPFFSDPRFQWIENPTRLGHLKNFEKAIQATLQSGAESIACSDQDDIWYPEKLSILATELEKLGPLGLVFCDMHVLRDSGKIDSATAWEIERRGVQNCSTYDLLVRNVIAGAGMLMDAELARRFPEIPEKAIYHDHWYPLVASRIGKIRPIHKPLYQYRIHSANVAGLSPFTGLLSRKDGDATTVGALSKCRTVWSRSHKLAQAAEGSRLSLSSLERISFLRNIDFGILLAMYGLYKLPFDPALARACWARAVGKVLECLRFSRELANQ